MSPVHPVSRPPASHCQIKLLPIHLVIQPPRIVYSCPPSVAAPSQPQPNQVAPRPSDDPAPENVVYSCPPSAAAPSQPQPNQVAPRPSGDPAPENVVNIHRRRNRAPRLPSNSRLLASGRQQQALSIDHTADEVQSNGNANGQDHHFVNHLVGDVTERSERAEPWQLQYYEPSTRDVIERAKQFSHCDAASIDPFPIRAKFNLKAIEYIDEAIAERRSRGLLVSDGNFKVSTASFIQLIRFY